MQQQPPYPSYPPPPPPPDEGSRDVSGNTNQQSYPGFNNDLQGHSNMQGQGYIQQQQQPQNYQQQSQPYQQQHNYNTQPQQSYNSQQSHQPPLQQQNYYNPGYSQQQPQYYNQGFPHQTQTLPPINPGYPGQIGRINYTQPQQQQQPSPPPPLASPQPASIPSTSRNRLIRPPYTDPQTNIIYDTDNAEFEGYLTKQSAWLKEWRRRYFILKGSKLFFAKNEYSAPHGMMDLAHCTTVKSADLKAKKRHSFEISTPDTCYLLYADTEAQKDEWIGRVGKAIVRCSRTYYPRNGNNSAGNNANSYGGGNDNGEDEEDDDDDIYTNDDPDNPYYND